MSDTTKSAVLVLIEQDVGGFSQINLRVMGAVHHLREFAELDVDLLVIGKDCGPVADVAARVPGIRQVLMADGESLEHQLPETLAPWLATIAGEYAYLIVGATTFGKNVLPRVAALMDIQPVTDVVAITSANSFKRPIYAGSALVSVKTDQPIKLLSIRASSFTNVILGEARAAPIIPISAPAAQQMSRFIGQQQVQSARPDLASARVVVSGGRGMQAGENFQLLYQLADKLNAAVGASRAAVDAGFVPNDM